MNLSQGYGCLVDTPDNFKVEIVRWPAKKKAGDLSILNTGDEAGNHRGCFRQ